MKKLSKRWIIILSILVVSIIILIIVLSMNSKLISKKSQENETSYIAYVDINPLIKLNFKVSCDKDNNCSDPIVTDYELINDDAKTIYKDLVIKEKTLKETIELLTNTVKDKDIVFQEVHIYSNYDKEEDFKVESTDYNITFDAKTDKDLKQFIDELVVKKENTITKEILVPFLVSMPEEMLNQDPKSLDSLIFDDTIAATIIDVSPNGEVKTLKPGRFKLLEHEDLLTTMSCYKEDFKSENNKNETFDSDALKITISGPAELINTIPNELCGFNNDYVEVMLKITESKVGEYILPMNINSKNPDIKILNPTSIKVKFKIIRLGDANVSAILD